MTSSKQRRLAAFAASDRSHVGRHNDWDRLTSFARYCPETGRILETGSMSLAALDRLEADRGWAYLRQAAQPDLHYVDLSGLTPRRRAKTACPAQINGYILSGQPAESQVTVTDAAGDVTPIDHNGEPVAFQFAFPGAYVIRVASIQHTDGVYSVEVAP